MFLYPVGGDVYQQEIWRHDEQVCRKRNVWHATDSTGVYNAIRWPNVSGEHE
jgi:hypothetical protein